MARVALALMRKKCFYLEQKILQLSVDPIYCGENFIYCLGDGLVTVLNECCGSSGEPSA